MTWGYLNENSEACTYSPVPAAESSQTSSLDTVPSALSNMLPTPEKSCSLDKQTEAYRDSRSGMMSEPSTVHSGAGASMSSAAGSRAKTSAQPEKEQASTGHEAGSGVKWLASFARYDRDSCSWRTAQLSLIGGSELFSETWPRWGSMRNGVCWAREMLGRPTKGIESGYWRESFPTPCLQDSQGAYLVQAQNGKFQQRKRLYLMLADGLSPRRIFPNPTAYEALMGWPLGWTELRPLETDRFPSAQPRHSRFSGRD